MGQSCCSTNTAVTVERNTVSRPAPRHTNSAESFSNSNRGTTLKNLFSSDDDKEEEELEGHKGHRLSTLFKSPTTLDQLRFDASTRSLVSNSSNTQKQIQQQVQEQPLIQPVSRRVSTLAKNEENIVSGWKSAILSGNDSLVATLWQDYKMSHACTLSSITFGAEESGHNSNALMMACKLGSAKIVEFVLSNNVISAENVNDVDNAGNTALHYACYAKCVHAVKSLLFDFDSFGAAKSLDIENKAGLIPKDIVKQRQFRNKKILDWITHLMEEKVLNSIDVDGYQSSVSNGSSGSNKESDANANDTNDTNEDLEEMPDGIEVGVDVKLRLERKSTSKMTFEEKERERKELETYKREVSNPMRTMRSWTHKSHAPNGEKSVSRGDTIMRQKQAKLPKMEAWLMKQRRNPPRKWHKRFVQVKGGTLFWNDEEKRINDVKNLKERSEFNGNISLNVVTQVSEYEMLQKKLGKKMKNKYKRRFVITVSRHEMKGESRDYCWECSTEKDRDFWVKGLKKHIKFVKDAAQYGFVI